jgi:hypothetical protein
MDMSRLLSVTGSAVRRPEYGDSVTHRFGHAHPNYGVG